MYMGVPAEQDLTPSNHLKQKNLLEPIPASLKEILPGHWLRQDFFLKLLFSCVIILECLRLQGTLTTTQFQTPAIDRDTTC